LNLKADNQTKKEKANKKVKVGKKAFPSKNRAEREKRRRKEKNEGGKRKTRFSFASTTTSLSTVRRTKPTRQASKASSKPRNALQELATLTTATKSITARSNPPLVLKNSTCFLERFFRNSHFVFNLI